MKRKKKKIMLNYVELIGKIVEDPRLETYDEIVVCYITLAVERPYRNAQGEYDTDLITVSLWDNTAINCSECCKKDGMVLVRGRLQTKTKENIQYYEVVGDKILFLHYE